MHKALIVALLLLTPGAALAKDSGAASKADTPPADKNGITVEVGGQAGYLTYGSFLRLGAGYHRYLSGRTWLDFGGGVLVRKETDIVFNGGVRFKFGSATGWQPFVRVGAEVAILARLSQTRVVVAARGGGGAGYFGKGGAGLTFQAGLSLGPAFGGSVRFAMAMDFMLGAEIPF